MLDPWKTHRAKGILTEIKPGMYSTFVVALIKGGSIEGYKEWQGKDMIKGLKIGDVVNVQASWSITGDRYLIQSINKPRARR